MATVARPDVKGQKVALSAQYYVNRVKSGKMKINQVPKGFRKNVQAIIDQPVETVAPKGAAKPKTGGRPKAWRPTLVNGADPNDPIVKKGIEQARAAYKVNPIEWRVSRSGAVLPPNGGKGRLSDIAASEGSSTNVETAPGQRGATSRSGKRTIGTGSEPIRTKTRESGAERVLRDMETINSTEGRKRISDALKEIESGKAKLTDFNPAVRKEITALQNERKGIAKKAVKKVAPAEAPRGMSTDEIRKQFIDKAKQDQADAGKKLAAQPKPPRPRPAGKFKPVNPSTLHKPGSTKVAPKSGGLFTKGQTAISTKDGVLLERAQKALDAGLISQSEYGDFVKQHQMSKDVKAVVAKAARSTSARAVADKAKPAVKGEKKSAFKKAAPAAPASPPATTDTAPSARSVKKAPRPVVKVTEPNLPGMGPKAPAVKKAAAAGKKFKQTSVTKPAAKPKVKSSPKNYVQGVIEDIGKADKGKIVRNAATDALVKAGPGKAARAAKFVLETAMVAPIVKQFGSMTANGVNTAAKFLTGGGSAPKPKSTGNLKGSINARNTGGAMQRTKKFAAAPPVTGNIKATYTVKHGDTLWDIAGAHNTSVSKILDVNPIIKKRKETGKVSIFAGTKVRIPKK